MTVIERPQRLESKLVSTVMYTTPLYGGNDLRTGLPCPSGTSSESLTIDLWTDTRTGQSNPMYKSQIRRAEQAGTPLHATKREIVRKPASLGSCSKPQKYWCGSCITASGNVLPLVGHEGGFVYPLASQAANQALTAFVKSAQAAMTPWSGATFVGEIRQTLRMVKHPLQALRRSIDAYFAELKRVQNAIGYPPSRLNRRQRTALRNALGGTYLEYQFGWLQLLRDIEGIGKRLDDIRPQAVTRVSGSGTASAGGQGAILSVSGGGHKVSYRANTAYMDSVRVRGGVRISGAGIPAGQSFGFSWPEFVPTAWELCPWSFFADYFTNISEIIGAAFQVNSGLAWAIMTRKQQWATNSQILAVELLGPGENYGTNADPGSTVLVDTVVDRTILESIIPGFTWEIPGYKQALNIGALILQGGVKRPFY